MKKQQRGWGERNSPGSRDTTGKRKKAGYLEIKVCQKGGGSVSPFFLPFSGKNSGVE